MEKKRILLTLAGMLMILYAGCGKQMVSNDRISIRQYTGLKVDESEDNGGFEDQVWETLLENCTVKQYPQDELDALVKELETEYGYVSYYKGKTAAELVQEIHGVSIEELAKEQLKKQYAVALIVEEEGLQLTEEEYQEELERRATANGIESVTEYENMFGKEQLVRIIQEERVFNILIGDTE